MIHQKQQPLTDTLLSLDSVIIEAEVLNALLQAEQLNTKSHSFE